MYNKIIQVNREKFEKYNSLKNQRFQDLLPNTHIKKIINSIPFMLCANDPKLPGYIRGDVPFGISHYKPDEEVKKFIRSKFPGAKSVVESSEEFVQMIAIMGSIGTIAYNKKSDFDYWVCINKHSVSNEMYLNFRRKVELIAKWAEAEIKLPVHIFINDINSVRNNIFDEDDEEAFGSTVGAVLKDEFYRSSIIIAGKIPFWWVVPQFTQDKEYEHLFSLVPHDDDNFIDFGNLYSISKQDFLGAALFQIIKSMGNPFKSILKLGILEKYLFSKEKCPLISHKLKKNIQRGNIDNTILDSYLMMFEEVYDYYKEILEDKSLLKILRQNLYLKISPQISKYAGVKNKNNIPYSVSEMGRRVISWGWNSDNIKSLDNFDNWDFNKIMKFWDQVQRFMLISYQKISSQFPAMDIKDKISESDFKLLSRKIKSHYSRSYEKIDNFVTFKDTPSEAILYIEPLNQGIKAVEWRLFKRNTSERNQFVTTTIKTEDDLLKLMAWAALNGIYDPKFSRLNVQSGYVRINQNFVLEFINQLADFFTQDKMKIKNNYMLRPVFNLLNFIVLNFNQKDAEHINEIRYIFHTSWGESYVKTFKSQSDLTQILVNIIKDSLILKLPFDKCCVINSPDPHKKIYKNISKLFKTSYEFLVIDNNSKARRFVTKIGDLYFVMTTENGKFEMGTYPNYIQMVASFTLKPKKEVEYKFYNFDDDNLSLLENIISTSSNDSIKIYYEEKNKYLYAYIVNEKGNLFAYFKEISEKDQFLSYIFSFASKTVERIVDKDRFSRLKKDNVNIFSIKRDRFGKFIFKDETNRIMEIYLTNYGGNCAYSLFLNRTMARDYFYNVVFPDGVESGFMTIKEIYSVAERIKDMKSKRINIGNYVQEMDLLDRLPDDNEYGSTLYFLEKYKVEFILEKSLKA